MPGPSGHWFLRPGFRAPSAAGFAQFDLNPGGELPYNLIMKKMVLSGLSLFVCGLLTACTTSQPLPTVKEDAVNLEITSPAFEHEAGIPEMYTCQGQEVSPPLQWAAPPPETKSWVLIMDDPDAPMGTWDHWLLYNLPPETRQLEEGIATLPQGTLVGRNSSGENAYQGPCPPGGGRHRYFFKLYALDTRLDLEGGVKKSVLETAMQGHIVAQGELIGIYKP